MAGPMPRGTCWGLGDAVDVEERPVDCLRWRAATLHRLGERDEAAALMGQALEVELADEWGLHYGVTDIARMWLELGEPERAYAAARSVPTKKRSQRGGLFADLTARWLARCGCML